MNRHFRRAASQRRPSRPGLRQIAAWLALVPVLLSPIAPAHAFSFSKKSKTEESSSNKAGRRTDSAFDDAIAKIKAGDYAGSIPLLQKSLAANPTNADALSELGHSLRKVGRLDESLQSYQKALALNPKHLNAAEYLGELYLEMKRPDLARKELEVLTGLCPSGCEPRSELEEQIAAYRPQ